MNYRVEGADEKTGKDRVEVISANSQAEAVKFARAMGLLVSGIKETGNPRPVATPAAKPVDYAAPGQAIPTYKGLSIASRVLSVYALLLYVLGCLALVAAVVAGIAVAAQRGGGGLEVIVAFLTPLGPAIALLFAGAIAHGGSAALQALRDIAINSFRT